MKAIFFSCILIVAGIFCYANMHAVDTKRLPAGVIIANDLKKLLEYEPMVINWSAEWKYDVPKKTISDFLEGLYAKVCTIAEKNKTNIEVILLKAVLEHYQYNLDTGDYFDAVIETIRKAKAIDPKDYRPGWILANHYYKGIKAIDAWSEFRCIVDSMPYKKLSPYFWEDYAAFCYMTRMPATMKMAVSHSNELLGRQSDFERIFKKQIDNSYKIVSPDTELDESEVWEVDKHTSPNRTSLFSRLFAISISIDGNWMDTKMNIGGLSDKRSYVFSTLGPEKGLNDSSVNYSIVVLLFANPEDDPVSDWTDVAFSKEKGFRKSKLSFALKDAIVFEGSSKTTYSEQGGSRSIALALKRNQAQWPGTKIERPILINTEGSEEVQYYQIKPPSTRFDCPIIYIILLDTCEAVYKKSFEVFSDLVNNRLVIE